MYPDSTVTSCAMRSALCGALLIACNSADEPAAANTAATARAATTAAAATPRSFVVDSQRDSIDAGSIVVFTLDFAESRRLTAAGDRQLDSVHPLPGALTGCDPANERAYLAAIGNLQPRDTGYVDTMQVALSNATRAPDAATSLCFAVHTRTAGWTWHWSPLPITIDRGTRDFGNEPGAGHFDLDIHTADVDAVALMLAYGQEQLSQLSYTALPASR